MTGSTVTHDEFNPAQIEAAAQHDWQEQQCFKVTEDLSREKFYCLAMFPYPSGKLHMGHVRVYTIADVIARLERMRGKNVLQPMGWDAFGLPAENAAINHKAQPAEWTYRNINVMREQMQKMGFAYDWRREITTCKPEYYRWEQWLFTRLFKKGLVYKKKAFVNWDPVDQTVLANEQVVDGRGWRSDALVEQREINQWFIKITAYAEELLNELEKLTGWPEQVKQMQKNWIGRSEGIVVDFALAESQETLSIYTTRPDTLHGVSFLALAPQHPLAKAAAVENPALQAFLDECMHTKVSEAELATQEKKGIVTPFHVIHPLTGARLPVWIANFVLMEYGAGAIMAVPAHDERDHEFALKYQLPIIPVIHALDSQHNYQRAASTAAGIMMANTGQWARMPSAEAWQSIADHLEKHKLGRRQVHYRLRDWGVSRQRYWGAPIPMIQCQQCGDVPVPEAQLPVILPEKVDFQGATSPLSRIPEFTNTHCPDCSQPALRETDTFDTFVESSWYYARFTCPDQDTVLLDDRAKYWTPVDQYVGGNEHAVMHLLYARFYHKLLRDEGFVNSNEPFTRLLTQGMVLKDSRKMSKSVGNIVDPEQLISQYGADTVRLFMIFAAPPEQNLEWSDSGVEGCHRFLRRVWTFAIKQTAVKHLNQQVSSSPPVLDPEKATEDLKQIRRELHQILNQTLYDYERQQFNTVVSGCMKCLNTLQRLEGDSVANVSTENNFSERDILMHEGLSHLLRLLAPIAPHCCHMLWKLLDFPGLIIDAPLPKVSKEALITESYSLIVQINGKKRAEVEVAMQASKEEIERLVLAIPAVQKHIGDKPCRKIIVVPQKLVNIVI